MSDIDMSQFHDVFFEEAAENLEVLERGLLDLEPSDAVDLELVNTIFRAAHTIKGGAGSFGFSAVSEFTHTMETLLDEVRAGQRAVTSELVECLLEAQDGLGELLRCAREDREPETASLAVVVDQMQTLLQSDSAAPDGATDNEAVTQVDAEISGWRIGFIPLPHLMHTGNDPVRIFQELAELGELRVQADLSQLPAWEALTPDDCHLRWQLELRGEVERATLDDIFLWIEGDVQLSIEPLSAVDAGEIVPALADREPPLSESQPGIETAEPEPRPATSLLKEQAVTGDVIVERRKAPDRREEAGRRKSDAADQASIRVSIPKIDKVINQVGELITTQSMLSNLQKRLDPNDPDSFRAICDHLEEAVDQFERHTRELQEHVMSMRMLPISFVFSRFGRTLHDLCRKLDKKVELHLVGEHTELDKTVIEKIADPMMHLIRNSMDHGFESGAERLQSGKPETGTLLLNAYHKGGSIFIEICDDGRGLDRDKLLAKALEKGLLDENQAAEMNDDDVYQLIMLPGFSTAAVVSDVSGRGVGMDVVRSNIDELKGEIQIRSEKGIGTTITIRLPLTLAIMDGQLVNVGSETYVVPVVSIVESVQVTPEMVRTVGGRGELLNYRDDYLPVLRLGQLFDCPGGKDQLDEGVVVILDVDGKRLGIFVDSIYGQQQVAVKSMEVNYQRVAGIMGATILGDGCVALILDPPGLSRMDSVALH